MDYRRQIEKILAASDNRAMLEAMDMLAQSAAVFNLRLREQGLDRGEALALTLEWFRHILESSGRGQS